jgi:hypothetical protein
MHLNLSDDESSLLTHVMMWGSDGYPIKRLGHGWTWNYRSISHPKIFKTKREAIVSFEAFESILIDKTAGRI